MRYDSTKNTHYHSCFRKGPSWTKQIKWQIMVESTESVLESQITQLMQLNLPSRSELKALCEKAKEILIQESNIQPVTAPVTVVGDLHGKFHDLLQVFNVSGHLPETTYLFLGNYINRGPCSVETISLLIALKVRYPSRITLLRGNHETRQLSRVYGFYNECIEKYSTVEWGLITDLFDYFPIAAVIGSEIFCVHGGLSPQINTLEEIKQIDRFQEIPSEGLFSDLMWSDPSDSPGFTPSLRGAGFLFGEDVSKKFCHTNHFKFIARALQLAIEGYQWTHADRVVTVHSNSNHLYRCGNKGAVMEVSSNMEIFFNHFYNGEGVQIPPRVRKIFN